ncbi:oxidoreductase [Haladaptatus sp. R4]|uniref:Gfo/Idh/MocA family protein n=1 Tax=Haladaptatus sp. R4 TaxID=1679489 RepID=UPI0007B4BD31|nr:Gfo/Idh/MocA family oxidoreductase [Haladaptatus sp. R4]KZN22672.1 oxidoreductase [Haladaptatus sp. R4]
MDELLRYGIVGCIGIGQTHGQAVQNVDGVELVACSDVVPENAQSFAEEFDCVAYTDTTEMIKDANIDAISVCTPSGTHSQVVIEAAEAGAHILCEKPLDIFADRMDKMITACDDAGVTLAGVFQRRYDPPARRAKQAIDDGDFGDLVLGDTAVKWFRSQEYYDSGDWRGTREMDGGVLMNQAIHMIDRLCWLVGDVEEIWAAVDNVDRILDCEDTATMAVRFVNGTLGTIEGTTAVKGGLTRTEVNGTEGSITIKEDEISHFEVGTGEESFYHSETEHHDANGDISPLGTGHEAVVQDFVNALHEGHDPAVTGHEARKPVDIILAAYAAAERGEPVSPVDIREGLVGGPQVRAEDRD